MTTLMVLALLYLLGLSVLLGLNARQPHEDDEK